MSPPAKAYSRNGYIAGTACRAANATSCSVRLLKNGSLPITSAPACNRGKVAKTVSKSGSVLACRMWSCSVRVRAASCMFRDRVSALVGLVGLTSKAMIVAVGTSSRSTSSCFGPSSTPIEVTPVMLPPGLFMLATSPSAIGLPAVTKTIGIVVVAAFAASAGGVPATAAITVTLRRIRSANSAGSSADRFTVSAHGTPR